MTAGFAWKPEAHKDTKHVELLISKAEDIYQDHFDGNDVLVHSTKYSTYNLEQWNSDGGSFCVCPSLEPGVYHFVFRVDTGEEKELKISDYYDRTFLGNGRAVNYIELMKYANTDKPAVAKNNRKLTRREYYSLIYFTVPCRSTNSEKIDYPIIIYSQLANQMPCLLSCNPVIVQYGYEIMITCLNLGTW